MQQNDTTNLTGLIQDIERMTGLGTGNISGNPTKYKEFTARMNNWYDREVATILAADTRWNWDDSNYTDLPIGTADIVSGQSTYQFDPSWIRVINIQMADATTGAFADMVPDDAEFDSVVGPEEITIPNDPYNPLPITAPGFTVVGGTITLDTAPTTNIADGLKVYFQRSVKHFAADGSTDTMSPGFPIPFHRLLSYGPAYDYCLEFTKPQTDAYKGEIEELEDGLSTFMSERYKSDPPRLGTLRQSFR